MKIILFSLITIAACSSYRPVTYSPDQEGIRQAFLDKQPELKDCALKFGNDEKTPYLYEFAINADGTTTNHRVTGPKAAGNDLEKCVIEKMAQLKFAANPGAKQATVKQPINIWRKQE